MCVGAETLIPAGISAVGTLFGANESRKAARDQRKAIQSGNDQATSELRRQYDQTVSILQPRIQAGDAALSQMMTELGLGPLQSGGATTQNNPQAQFESYVDSNPDLAREFQNQGRFGSKADYGRWHYQTMGQKEGRSLPEQQQPAQNGMTGTQPAQTGFKTTPGYEFVKQEGIDTYDASAAARGGLLSGGQQKALAGYVTNSIAAPEYDRYYSRLSGIAQQGGQAGQALAGYGQRYGENQAGLATDYGESVANLRGTEANVNNNMWENLGGNVGDVLGSPGAQEALSGWF